MKKNDLPYMPFFWGDWFKAFDVQMLPREIRCTWFEMLGRMWEGNERGELSINGEPIPIEQLSQLLGFGVDIKECERHINFLEKFSLFSRKKNGIIYCRRMVKNEDISRKRSNSGRLGMKIRYNKIDNKKLTNVEYEIDNEIDNEVIKEKEGHLLDDSFFALWEDFKKMRKSLKKPMTERAEKIILNKLNNNDINTAKEMLENSIASSWTDVYLPKQKKELSAGEITARNIKNLIAKGEI